MKKDRLYVATFKGKAGDRVTSRDSGRTGTVLWIKNWRAKVRYDDGEEFEGGVGAWDWPHQT